MATTKQNLWSSPNAYAKTAGTLLLVTIVAGIFGEISVTSELVMPNDPEKTVANVRENIGLYRLGFAGYLLEAICDVTLTLLFYQLLKKVWKSMALLGVFFGLISTATYAFAELFYFLVPILIDNGYMVSFSQGQMNELIMLSIEIYGVGGGIFMLFYGIASMTRGFLIYKSGYLPKFLGIMLLFAGACFVLRNFLLVLAPEYATNFFLLPMLVTILTMAIWFLVKGIDVAKWEKQPGLV